MNNCPNCGTPLPQGAPSCPNCGTQFAAVQPAQVIYAQQAPVNRLSTSRGLLKYILLSMITFGIYGLVVMSSVSNDINVIASRYDGKKTMHYCLLTFIVLPLTFGIAGLVWFNNISARIGNELSRRGIAYSFSATDFWLWDVLGALIVIGPFVYMHKFFVAMNKLSENYNMYG